MFRPYLLLGLLALPFLLSSCTTASSHSRRTSGAAHVGKKMVVRTTAYAPSEAGGNRSAMGTFLRHAGSPQSAASDWSWLPLGTRFRMPSNGCTYVIEDYGSALVGRKTIDIYMPNMRKVRAWGTRQVEIEILEWGSKAMSLKLLEPRMRNKHVRQMVAGLRGR